jgi:hypothetical protein
VAQNEMTLGSATLKELLKREHNVVAFSQNGLISRIAVADHIVSAIDNPGSISAEPVLTH